MLGGLMHQAWHERLPCRSSGAERGAGAGSACGSGQAGCQSVRSPGGQGLFSTVKGRAV